MSSFCIFDQLISEIWMSDIDQGFCTFPCLSLIHIQMCIRDSIRICSENAIFGQPEVGLGITPGFGGTQRLARIVGVGKAKEMIYTAFNIKAEEAYRIGLVNAVYPQEELLAAAKKLANKIASNAPIAVRACKKAINEGLQVDMDQAIVVEEKAFGSCFETEDQKAGMGNFLEKDKAKKLKVVPFQNK